MHARIIQISGHLRALAARIIRNLWVQQLPHPRTVRQGLELALRPSPRWRASLWLLRLLVLTYGMELLLRRHHLAAAVVLLALLAFRGEGWIGPRHLRIDAAGRLFLTPPNGEIQRVRLLPSTMRLGGHLLLVLRGEGGTFRVLLGPDILAPEQLAGLRRRLPGGMASAATGVHSVAASGSKSSSQT